MKFWIAVEEASTCEVDDFGEAEEKDVFYLMEGYKVDLCHPEHVRVPHTEDGHRVVYDGVIYRGGFGYDLLVTRKYQEM